MTIIENYSPPVCSEKIEFIEKKLGIILPLEYKAFLESYNGGYPVPDVFDIPKINDSSIVDRFFGIDLNQYSNLETFIENYRNKIPKYFIPIARDPGGNLIVICLIGDQYGAIFFWDHEFETDNEKPDMSNLFFIAGGFGEFIENLYENEDV